MLNKNASEPVQIRYFAENRRKIMKNHLFVETLRFLRSMIPPAIGLAHPRQTRNVAKSSINGQMWLDHLDVFLRFERCVYLLFHNLSIYFCTNGSSFFSTSPWEFDILAILLGPTFATWQLQVDNGVTCGNCMALVLAKPYGGRCDRYCESFGQVCIMAAEEQEENCEARSFHVFIFYKIEPPFCFSHRSYKQSFLRQHQSTGHGFFVAFGCSPPVGDSQVKYEVPCNQPIEGTSDILCQCSKPNAPPSCPAPPATTATTTATPSPNKRIQILGSWAEDWCSWRSC